LVFVPLVDPAAGDGHPDHDLRQVLAGAFGVPVGAEPDPRASGGRSIVVDVADVTAFVAGDRGVGDVALEVGAGRVEEDRSTSRSRSVAIAENTCSASSFSTSSSRSIAR
jgi:hypothetical protein